MKVYKLALLLSLFFSQMWAQQPVSYWALTNQEQVIVDRLLNDLAGNPHVIPDLWLNSSLETIPELQTKFNLDYDGAKMSSINLYSITLQYYVNLNSIQYADYELWSILNYYDQWIAYYNSIIDNPNSSSSIISQALLSRGLIVSLKNLWPSGTYMY